MKKCKRFSCLIAAVLLCLTLVCPAYAADSSAPELTDEELYELEYERLLIEGNDDEGAIALLSLDDNNPDRTMSITGSIKYYWGALGNALTYDGFMEVPSSVYFSWQGSGSYKIAEGSISTASNEKVNMTIGSIAGTYVDWVAPSVYIYEEGSTLRFAGVVKAGFAGTWFKTGSFVDYNIAENMGTEIFLPPDRMAIVVNGEVVTSATSQGNGTFQFDYSFPMKETVISVAYRFYYDSTVKAPFRMTNTTGISTRGLWFCIDDDALAKYTVPDASTVVQKNILEQVKLIPSTIYNFFFGDSGDDAASGFKSDVDSAVSSVDQVQQEIEEGLDKPEPDTIVPDLEEVVPQEDYTVYTDIFAPVMQSSLFTSMMLVVVSMAFVSYVLFGKKG